MKNLFLLLFTAISISSIAQNDIAYYSGEKKAQKVLVEFRYDTKINPGDRITLNLEGDHTIFGKTFKSGTYIYAYTSLNDKKRIMLDIKNIDGMPVILEKAEDYGDHLEGIYIHFPKKKKKKDDSLINFYSGDKVILYFIKPEKI